MGKASDNIQKIALYASKAITANGVTPTFYTNWLGVTALENQVIAFWKQKGINFAYLSNGNQPAGFLATQYDATLKLKMKSFIAKCTTNGIGVGMVIGLSSSSTAPTQRVANYNSGAAANEKLVAVLIEDEYWHVPSTFPAFKANVIAVYNTLHPTGVACDVYIVRGNVGDLAQLVPYIDTFWLTTYLYAPRDNQPRYDAIHSWVVELANTLPSTPIKVGALVSVESDFYNKTGGQDANSNFLGYWVEGRQINAPFVNPQTVVTSPKNLNQLADKITHNGTVGLPPIDFNSEPTSVTNYIDWQGIQLFDWDLFPNLTTVNANSNQVWAIGDGSVADAINFPVAQQIAGLVPYNAARFLYLGDVYDTGTQAEYIGSTRSYDKLYGTQSNHNLLILTSATVGNHEWANRAVGYDPYWSGSLAGTGSVQPVWDGDRTITNPHYYSFLVGNWKFICINSMEDGIAAGGVTTGSPMYTWLVNELNSPSGDKRKIVFCHHPRWSDDSQHGDNTGMQPVWAAMQNKALILLTGHVHNYQRHNMRDASGAVVSGGGVYQIVSGAGGQDTYSFASSYLSGAVAYKTLSHGVSRLTLYDDHVDVCFLDSNGTVLDCATINVASVIPPTVYAGVDQSITLPATATMAGTAVDTNNPILPLTNIWTKISGAGTVTFNNPNALNAVATFSSAGTYVLRLTSNNGTASAYDEMTVTVGALPSTSFLTFDSNAPLVAIIIDVQDIYNQSNGITSFTRTYLASDTPTIECPSTASGLYFQRWLKDGAAYAYSLILTLDCSDGLAHTYTAEYGTPLPDVVRRVLIVPNISSTLASAYVKTDVDDITGFLPSGGFVPIQAVGYYYDGTTVTFTSSGSQVGINFLYWLKDGLPFVGNTNVVQTFTITADTTLTVVYDVAMLDTFEVTEDVVDATCPAGNATYTVTPVGAGTFTYSWDTGATTNSITVPTTYGMNNHTCIVTEITGIYTISAQTILLSSLGFDPIDATFDVVTTCGSTTADIQANPIGGLPPYTYLWSTGETTRSVTKVYGTYSVVVTDANGCSSASIPVTASASAAITLADVVTDPTCNGGENGQIVITITGGVAPYICTATISGTPVASVVVGNIATIGSLGVGTYDVLITDFEGCTATDSYAISEPLAITVSVAVTEVTCNGADDGIAVFTPTNGTAPYTYYVDGSLASATTTDLAVGSHTYLVIDTNGCTAGGTFSVTEPTALSATVTKTDITCNGADNGQAVVAGAGATPPYQYSLDGGAYGGSGTFTNISYGDHQFFVKDANSCVISNNVFFDQPTDLVITNVITNPTAPLTSDGSILITVTGGTFPAVATWQDGSTHTFPTAGSQLYDSIQAGIYQVTVVDSNSCSKVGNYTLVDPSPVPPVTPPADNDIDVLLPFFNCCLANKIYSVMKGYANGHAQIDCVAIPVMLLSEKIKLLASYYTAGQVIGGSKGQFVFKVDSFTGFKFTFSLYGFTTVTYVSDAGLTYDENMTAMLLALTTAGWDVELDAGRVFIYSPMNCYYNGLQVSYTINYIVDTDPPTPVKANIISKNGIMGASTPCNTDEVLNCITEEQKTNLIEEIRVACKTCLCGTATKDID